MRMTVKKLKELSDPQHVENLTSAYYELIPVFEERYPNGVDLKTLIRWMIREKKIFLDLANQLIVKCMTRKQHLRYAVYSAEQVIDIVETKYPDDDRPRKAIEAAKSVINKDTDENRSAAEDAARAVRNARSAEDTAGAARAARAAWAVWAAAWSAAGAAGATREAVWAAWSAAWAAVGAAEDTAREKMQIKILKYGLKIIEVKQ